MHNIKSPLGVIAGSGSYPLHIIEQAHALGLEVVVAAHRGETEAEVAEMADSVTWVHLGQLGKIIRTFKRAGVTNAILAGGIKRVSIFGGVRLDLRGIKLVARLSTLHDDVLLRGIAQELERDNIRVVSGTEILADCKAKTGVLTNRALSEVERKDARLAWEAARANGKLDIGQGAVAFERVVAAVEAVEGTDAMIKRAGELTGREGKKNKKGGPILVKVAKAHQDLRIDLPTVGLSTLENMAKAGFSGLVLEAEKAIILNPGDFVTSANKLGIAVEVHTEESIGSVE